MILYIILFVSLLCILFLGYIRIKYTFWALQPVFHFYDLHYWFIDAGIICKELPSQNKYYQPKIQTLQFVNVPEYKLTKAIQFIQTQYIKNKEYKENKFIPKKENVLPYFTGHNSKCFWSFFYGPLLIQDAKTNAIIEDTKIISILTTRPLHVEIITKNIIMDVYYVDYLCVDETQRKQGIAPQMIQTHEYNQRHSNKQICVSLFKREDELTGINPLCAYDTYGFNIKKWYKPQDLPNNITFLLCDKQNMYYLMDFIKQQKTKFDICILPEISNIIELIETKNIFIYMLMDETTICSVYFFRKTCTYVKKNEEVLSCFASINATSSEKVFIHGFKVAFWKIKEKYDDYKYLIVENISNNSCIINNLIIKTRPTISKTAYFFYNFAYHTFKSNKVFILN
jgi:hypothetical protein